MIIIIMMMMMMILHDDDDDYYYCYFGCVHIWMMILLLCRFNGKCGSSISVLRCVSAFLGSTVGVTKNHSLSHPVAGWLDPFHTSPEATGNGAWQYVTNRYVYNIGQKILHDISKQPLEGIRIYYTNTNTNSNTNTNTNTILYYTRLYYTIHTILYYTILYYTILYYTIHIYILHYMILRQMDMATECELSPSVIFKIWKVEDVSSFITSSGLKWLIYIVVYHLVI